VKPCLSYRCRHVELSSRLCARQILVNLPDRRRRLLADHIDALREATRLTQTRHPFTIDAIVVLADHIRAVWTLPPRDADSSLRRRLIKIDFAAMPCDRSLNLCRAQATRTVSGASTPLRLAEMYLGHTGR